MSTLRTLFTKRTRHNRDRVLRITNTAITRYSPVLFEFMYFVRMVSDVCSYRTSHCGRITDRVISHIHKRNVSSLTIISNLLADIDVFIRKAIMYTLHVDTSILVSTEKFPFTHRYYLGCTAHLPLPYDIRCMIAHMAIAFPVNRVFAYTHLMRPYRHERNHMVRMYVPEHIRTYSV